MAVSDPVFEVYRRRLYRFEMAAHDAFEYVSIGHESFTYVSPDVFSVSTKSLAISILQVRVRVSFSAPNASQSCGAFLFVGAVGYGIPTQDLDASDAYEVIKEDRV